MTDNAAATLAAAGAAHRAGQLEAAETLYQRLVSQDLASAELAEGIGSLAMSMGRFDDALLMFRRSLGLDPQRASAHHNLGLALTSLGRSEEARVAYYRAGLVERATEQPAADRYNPLAALGQLNEAKAAQLAGHFDEAEALYRQLLAQNFAQAEVAFQIGILSFRAGRLVEALDMFSRVVTFAPDRVLGPLNLGLTLARLGRSDEALAAYDRAALIDPASLQVRFERANLLATMRRFDEALAAYGEVVALAPDNVDAWRRRATIQRLRGDDAGALESLDQVLAARTDDPAIRIEHADLLQGAGRYEAALAGYDRALASDPAAVRAWSNRGVALQELNRPAEAIESYDRALALAPGFVDALVNRGTALRELNRLGESLASLGAAVQAAPDSAPAQVNLGVSQLLSGDLPAGFRGHEARWQVEPNRSLARGFTQPVWLGEADIAGRTLLLHGEQGFGDTIQFCRYAALAKARGARVVVEVQPALKALMRSLEGVDVLVGRGEALPAFDLHCPMMSLPLAFGTTLETIPAAPSYLAPPPERLAAWTDAVPASAALKLGVVWFGKPTHRNDRNRSLSLDRLVGALPPGAEVFSLQDRARDEDAATLAAHPRIRRFEGRLNDFADTAALASMMDLVVSVDTSAAHLAAAIGRPTWVLLPFSPDWRWLLGRVDSPWYPTVRLFRQPAIGDWDTAMDELRAALAKVAAERP